MTIVIKNTLFVACLCTALSSMAQLKQYPEIFPKLPFEVSKVTDAGYFKCTVWRGIYTQGANDLSGEMWSNVVEESYQYQKYTFPEGKMDLITTYLPQGKAWSMEFFYQHNLISAIEKLRYDSLQEPYLDFAYSYFYKEDHSPFQRVKNFGHPNKGMRVLDEFEFDTLNRVLRQKSTAVGQAPHMDSILGLKHDEKLLTLHEYSDSTLAHRVYKNLYVILEDNLTFFNAEGLAARTEVRNAEGKIITTIYYEYEGDKLTKKTYWVTRTVLEPELPKEEDKKKKKKKNEEKIITTTENVPLIEPQPEIYKVEYFAYNSENGLLEKHIIEENGVQTFLEYTYFVE